MINGKKEKRNCYFHDDCTSVQVHNENYSSRGDLSVLHQVLLLFQPPPSPDSWLFPLTFSEKHWNRKQPGPFTRPGCILFPLPPCVCLASSGWSHPKETKHEPSAEYARNEGSLAVLCLPSFPTTTTTSPFPRLKWVISALGTGHQRWNSVIASLFPKPKWVKVEMGDGMRKQLRRQLPLLREQHLHLSTHGYRLTSVSFSYANGLQSVFPSTPN